MKYPTFVDFGDESEPVQVEDVLEGSN